MKKLKFSELDPNQKRAVSWLADEAGTLTPTILAATAHVGELWEAKAFLKHFQRGSTQHEQLADRLRMGGAGAESILDCIHHAAPAYETLGDRFALELTDLLPELENGIAGL
ncbi:hypothetical protein [Noviherbaspirillum sedimenti]|nr:hypothetical protein [Noviherbaspirillum sedimenti]